MALLFERNIFGHVATVFITSDFNSWVFFTKVIFYPELRLLVLPISYNADCFELLWTTVNKSVWTIVNERKQSRVTDLEN